MRMFKLILLLIWSTVWLVSTVPRRKKDDTTQTYTRRTGEAVAVEDLIRKYEKEHQKFYEQENKNGNCLQWLVLDNKNLSNFCKKYLQHSVPTRTFDDVAGMKIEKTLYYQKENTRIISKIVMVQCKTLVFNPMTYYMTRAPELNCVYAVKSAGHTTIRFTIINKHCDFEDKPFKKKSSKWKRMEMVGKVNRITGQPIAKDELLLKYELEHQEMFKKEVKEGMHLGWPHTILYGHLDFYCYQYLRKCVPNKNPIGVKGSMTSEKLHYWKLNLNEHVTVTTISCLLSNAIKRYYYMMRAPEINCVYALLRQGFNTYSPLVIIFKHCDFEDPNNQRNFSQNHDTFDKNLIPRVEVKEETLDTLKTLKFLPL